MPEYVLDTVVLQVVGFAEPDENTTVTAIWVFSPELMEGGGVAEAEIKPLIKLGERDVDLLEEIVTPENREREGIGRRNEHARTQLRETTRLTNETHDLVEISSNRRSSANPANELRINRLVDD